MTTRNLTAAVAALACFIGCGQRTSEDVANPSASSDVDAGVDAGSPDTDGGPDIDAGPGSDGGGTDGNPGGDGGPGGDAPPQAACPIGAPAWTRAIGLARADQPSDVAVDAAGNVLFATAGVAGADPATAAGVTKLSPSGDVLFTRPYGSVVATDRAGNAYIAGAFRAPIDLGSRVGVLAPSGDVDVFVAKLDAAGEVVFARALGLCGDGVQSLAVDATGRIAVSGTAMGTVVLDATGAPVFTRPVSGAVAFSSRGDLLIAGSFTASIDLGAGPIASCGTSQGFVLALDRTGEHLWHHVLTGSGVRTTGVAVDTADHVVVVGYYEDWIDLFGDVVHAVFASESGRVTGAYAVQLDVTGAVRWKQGAVAGSEAHAVATDPSDAVIVAGAATGGAGFFRTSQLARLDAAGTAGSLISAFAASGYGRALDVATDACGSIYVSANALDTPSPAATLRVHVTKITP